MIPTPRIEIERVLSHHEAHQFLVRAKRGRFLFFWMRSKPAPFDPTLETRARYF